MGHAKKKKRKEKKETYAAVASMTCKIALTWRHMKTLLCLCSTAEHKKVSIFVILSVKRCEWQEMIIMLRAIEMPSKMVTNRKEKTPALYAEAM